MFCPNCGNVVSDTDNYCAICGKKLKNVQVKVENLEKKSKSSHERTKDVTRVFNPKKLDAIDNTDDIKNIIAAVDKKVSENIREYELRNNTQDKLNKINELPILKDSPKKKSSKTRGKYINLSGTEEISIKNDIDKVKKSIKTESNEISDPTKIKTHSSSDFNISQAELIKRVQEELKKENYNLPDDEDSSPALHSSKYATAKADKSIKLKKPFKNFWKDFINEDDDEFSIFNNINKDKSIKTKETRNFEFTNTEDFSNKSIEDTMSVPKITSANEKVIDKILSDQKKQEKKATGKTKANKNSLFTSIKKSIKKKTSTLNNKDNFRENDDNKKETKLSGLKENIQDDFKSQKVVLQADKKNTNFYLSYLKKFSILNINFSEFLTSIKSKESIILLILGLNLIFVSMFIGQGKVSPYLFLFLVLKVIFDYFQFVIPLKVAKDKTDLFETKEKFNLHCLINWFYAKLFLFIGFVITPIGGFFQFSLLKAMTPMPIATIILIILSPIIALSFYIDSLEKRKIIDFIGWYSLLFILFELCFKLVWFGLNFIFNTLF